MDTGLTLKKGYIVRKSLRGDNYRRNSIIVLVLLIVLLVIGALVILLFFTDDQSSNIQSPSIDQPIPINPVNPDDIFDPIIPLTPVTPVAPTEPFGTIQPYTISEYCYHKRMREHGDPNMAAKQCSRYY